MSEENTREHDKNGRVRIADGHFTDLELPPLLARHNALARTLLQG